MKNYKGYQIKVINSRYTNIYKEGKFIKWVDSYSSAKYVIDKNWI